jgi:hypothetical protein
MTQLVLTSISIDRHVDEIVRSNSIGMLVEYGTPRFVREGGIDPTQLGDVKYGSLLTLDYYKKGMKIEYFLEHEDSMEE